MSRFCEEWGLVLNTTKTKVMVFNRPGKLVNIDITYNGAKLENTLLYKYLGIQFHISGKLEFARKDLLDRSMKAMYKLIGCLKNVKPSFNMYAFV